MIKKGETFHWYGETPWNDVGEPVDNSLSPQELLAKAGLDWTVERHNTYIKVGDQEILCPKQALVRSDRPTEIITEVPSNWHVLQNLEAAEWIHKWIERGNLKMISAGSLKGGRLVWFLAEIGERWSLFGGDEHRNNLLFTVPHQYGKAIDIRQTPLRIACNNMIAFALSRTGHLTIRFDHRRQVDANMIEGPLQLAHDQFTYYRELGERLGSVEITEEELVKYVTSIYPVQIADDRQGYREIKEMSSSAMTILENFGDQPGIEYAPGTWWAAFNAITYYASHQYGSSRDSGLHALWYGKQREKVIEALNYAHDAVIS